MTGSRRQELINTCERIIREMDVNIIAKKREITALQAEIDERVKLVEGYEQRKRDAEDSIGHLRH